MHTLSIATVLCTATFLNQKKEVKLTQQILNVTPFEFIYLGVPQEPHSTKFDLSH